MNFRIGSGLDVHKIGPGNGICLGGFRIPCDFGLIGHSDADVLLHALCDAIYGAIAEGDIGFHFPDNQEVNKERDSTEFLSHALNLLKSRNYRISNIDLTVICERPKVSPYRDKIRKRLEELCGIPADQIGLKATTTEKLGFTGRGEGITATASILIYRKA